MNSKLFIKSNDSSMPSVSIRALFEGITILLKAFSAREKGVSQSQIRNNSKIVGSLKRYHDVLP